MKYIEPSGGNGSYGGDINTAISLSLLTLIKATI